MNDEEYGPRILRPLDEEPDAPSRVDVAAAVVAGSRSRRRRRVAATAAAAAAGLAIASVPVVISQAGQTTPDAAGRPSASAKPSPSPKQQYDRTMDVAFPTSCTGEALPVPGGGQSHASALDPTGRYATYRTYVDGRQPIIWHDGTITKVGTPGDDDGLYSINSNGVAVGIVWKGTGPVAIAAEGAKSAQLPGGKGREARAINDHGVIVGGSFDEDAPLRWASRTSQPEKLPLPKGATRAMAYDIDTDGTIVGYVETGAAGAPSGADPAKPSPSAGGTPGAEGTKVRADGARGGRIAYVWPAKGPGRVLERPTAPGVTIDYYDARGISNGWVVGFAAAVGDDRATYGVRWDLNTGKAELLPGLEWSNGINQYGWIAGMTEDNHAALTDGKRVLRLPDVFAFDKQYGMNWAEAVSDDGRTLIGNVDDADRDGLQQAVVWRCS
ncbi:hypothetical protein [Catellatospora sp. NPDC049609]|uniref:hypothetical protein n=1 Tax=Catellatospora sp. NPDC049609 TaxID=3155505 RepID=UPI003449CA5E